MKAQQIIDRLLAESWQANDPAQLFDTAVTAGVDPNLVAKAVFDCVAYAASLTQGGGMIENAEYEAENAVKQAASDLDVWSATARRGLMRAQAAAVWDQCYGKDPDIAGAKSRISRDLCEIIRKVIRIEDHPELTASLL